MCCCYKLYCFLAQITRRHNKPSSFPLSYWRVKGQPFMRWRKSMYLLLHPSLCLVIIFRLSLITGIKNLFWNEAPSTREHTKHSIFRCALEPRVHEVVGLDMKRFPPCQLPATKVCVRLSPCVNRAGNSLSNSQRAGGQVDAIPIRPRTASS